MNVRCVLLVPCRTDRTDIARLVGTGRAAGFRMGLWVMCHHFPTLSRSIRATARFLSARDPQFWQNQRGARFEFFGFSNRGTRCWTLHRPSSFVRSHTRQERVEMVHKVLAPIKPTGGAIGVGLLVGFAGAAVCTQFLSLNMPFGGATIFQPAPEFYPVPLGAPLGDCLRSSIAPPTVGFAREEYVHRRVRTVQTGRTAPSRPRTPERSRPANPNLRDISADALLPTRPHDAGALPHTVTNPEWAKATAEIMKSSWEREGAPDRPIGLNPMKGPK